MPLPNKSLERTITTCNEVVARSSKVIVSLPPTTGCLRTAQYNFALERKKLCIAHAICKLDLNIFANCSLRISFARTLDAEPVCNNRPGFAFLVAAPDAILLVHFKCRYICRFEAVRAKSSVSWRERIDRGISNVDFVSRGSASLGFPFVF